MIRQASGSVRKPSNSVEKKIRPFSNFSEEVAEWLEEQDYTE
jgi:hypothetical protein